VLDETERRLFMLRHITPIAAAALLVGCSCLHHEKEAAPAAVAAAPAPSCRYISEIVGQTPELSSLASAASDAGLTGTLKAAGSSYTLFAPSNAAFAQLPAGMSTTDLANTLKYHLVSGSIPPTVILPASYRTVSGGTVNLTRDANGRMVVNGVPVVRSEVPACNGVVYTIDGVLSPM
jgi:uncharacterized surface protein with fasciclin (FAS1) repeats